jgi:hypothetical protein
VEKEVEGLEEQILAEDEAKRAEELVSLARKEAAEISVKDVEGRLEGVRRELEVGEEERQERSSWKPRVMRMEQDRPPQSWLS